MEINRKTLLKLRKHRYTKKDEKLDFKIKETIFGVLYVLLKDSETNHYLELVLSLIEHFQFLLFPFHSAMFSAWGSEKNDNSAAVWVNYILSHVNPSFYLEKSTDAQFFPLFYGMMFLIYCVVVNITYVSISFSRKYFTHTWPLYLLQYVVKIFVTILFTPLCGKILYI